MNFIDFNRNLKDFAIFSLKDIRKIYPGFHRQRLSEWINKGYLKKIVNGFYFFTERKIDEKLLFYFANTLYHPSYVSMESALSYYNIIPEGVYNITSVSTRRTRELNSPAGKFFYHKIKNSMFFGYRIIRFKSYFYKIAEPEKSIIDTLYLNNQFDNEESIYELRINVDEFKNIINLNKMNHYLKFINNRKLISRANLLLNIIYHAAH